MDTIRSRAWRKVAIAAVLALCFLYQVCSTYFAHYPRFGDSDFRVYYFTAQVIHNNHRADIYTGALGRFPLDVDAPPNSPIALQAAKANFPSAMLYIYPPLLADLLTPFSSIPVQVAAKLWRALNLILFYGMLLPLAKLARVRILSGEFAVLVLAAFCFHPFQQSIYLGQANVALCALWVLGIWAYEREWVLSSAALLALATALKVTPLVVFPLFLIWKDRRWLIGYFSSLAGIATCIGAFNGFASLREFCAVGASMSGGAPIVDNQCISSVIAWLYFGHTFDHDSVRSILPLHIPSLSLAIKLAEALFYFLCLWLVWESRKQIDRRDKASSLAIFALVALSVAPVSWRPSYAIAIVPLVMQWARWLEGKSQWMRLAVLSVTSVLIWLSGFEWSWKFPLSSWPDIVASSTQVFAVTVFCIVELAALGKRPHGTVIWQYSVLWNNLQLRAPLSIHGLRFAGWFSEVCGPHFQSSKH